MSSRPLKKVLFNFILALLTLLILLLTLLFLAGLDQKIVENRANEFCDSISVGARLDRTELRERIRQTKNTRAAYLSGMGSLPIDNLPAETLPDGSILVQFRARLPHYYICSFDLRGGKVVEKQGVQYRD